MKKYTGYFVVSSIALLFLIGFFVFFSANTYSVESEVTISVPENNLTFPISGRKTINVSVNTDGEMNATEMAKYSINWEVSSSSVSLDSNNTSLSSPNNIIYSSDNIEDGIVVSLYLMYEGNDEVLSTEQVYVNVVSVKEIPMSNVLRNSNTFDISDGVTQLSIPSEYESFNIEWSSSNPNILSVSSDGYATPLSTGNVNLTATVYDEDDNVIALGSETVSVTDNEGKTDYTLKSLSVNDENISLNNSGYVYNINEGNTFRINAQANGNHDILIYDENDNIYENNSTIQLVGSSMSFTICVGDNLEQVGDDCGGKYTLIVGKNQTQELSSYLSSLSINSESFDPDDEELFVCDSDGNILTCNIEYSVVYGTDKIVIDATPVNGYHFSEDLGPGTFELFDDDVNFVLEVIKDGDSNPSAYYSINVSFQGSADPTEKPTTNNNTGSNPGTGDISSFIIFMIMLMSLIASLFVYKKNIESK